MHRRSFDVLDYFDANSLLFLIGSDSDVIPFHRITTCLDSSFPIASLSSQ